MLMHVSMMCPGPLLTGHIGRQYLAPQVKLDDQLLLSGCRITCMASPISSHMNQQLVRWVLAHPNDICGDVTGLINLANFCTHMYIYEEITTT